MRRGLAAALLGISLWIGSLAWSGFVMTRTVLDPGRSQDVAEALLENDAVRAQLVANIASGIEAGLPDGARVDRATLESGAEAALDSPAVKTLVLDALIRSHQAFLGEGTAPKSIDGGAFGAAARQSIVDAHPELDGLLPAAPSFEVPLPTDRIPNLGPVRRGLLTAVPILAGIAVIGAGLALLVTTDRPGVVRRAGFWALGLSAFILVVAYGIPAAARQVAPDQAEVIAALIGALAAATRGPALALAGAGLAGLVVSLFWKPASSVIRSERPAPVVAGPPRRPRRDVPVRGRRPGRTTTTAPIPIVPSAAGPIDTTRVQPAAAPPVSSRPPQPQRAARANARWVEGVGWVHDGTDAIPDSARWIPGVGYVLEDE